MLLQGKIALVVGVRGEIGSATAEKMAQEGAKVVIGERNSDKGKAIVSKILAAGGEAIFQEIDITLNRQQKALIKTIVEQYGRLDLAFNSVSIEGDFLPLARQAESVVTELIDTNFNGVWLCLKYQIEQMLKNNGGAIVNNVCNFKADGSPGCSIYRATKSAVATMSQIAALEYARDNIRINAIAPGILERSPSQSVPSQMKANSTIIPINRGATPQEIAEAVVWLCSDKSSYITGQTLAVDGGLSALSIR